MENKDSKAKEIPDCCKSHKKSSGLMQGIIYGTIPHIGCIAFVVASILGVSFAATLFKPLLAKAYFFYIMVALSLFFATISALFYLRKQGGIKHAKHHKKYLGILYGSTIAVSLILYFLVFPLVTARVASTGQITQAEANKSAELILSVDIPCAGHGPLITSELQTLPGIEKIDYQPIKTFKITYDTSKTSKENILELEIFKEYKASVIG